MLEPYWSLAESDVRRFTPSLGFALVPVRFGTPKGLQPPQESWCAPSKSYGEASASN